MSSYDELRQKDSDESAVDQDATAADGPELCATVRLESQAKVDSEAIEKVAEVNERDHPYGMTLEAEEKWAAREQEKARTRERQRTQSTLREQGSRASVQRGREQARRRVAERRASVDPTADPRRPDPREELSQDDLAAVNQQARDIAKDVRGAGSRASVSRQLAERVASGSGLLSASVAVMDAERKRAGTVVPIGELEAIDRQEVTIEGRVTVLWDNESPAIQQVGLIEDDSGQTKVTIWKASEAPWIEDGERVRLLGAARNWYDGRVSVAVTGWSTIQFPERGRWWE